MDIWLAFIAGIMIGVIGVIIRTKADLCGRLRIDRSEKDNKPYLFLELSKDVKDVCDKKYVIFEVYEKDFITHK